jgi:hypothetical protein
LHHPRSVYILGREITIGEGGTAVTKKVDKHRGRPQTKYLPRVYNSHNGDGPLSARYCGRGSPWGNPFVIGGWWPAKQRRMTRDDVCDRFRDEILPTLDVSELRGQSLECYCAPLRCHCDDIIRKANPNYDQRLKERQETYNEKRLHKESERERKTEYEREWKRRTKDVEAS